MKIRFYAQHNNLSSVECWNFPDYLVTAKVYYKKLLKMVFKPATGKIGENSLFISLLFNKHSATLNSMWQLKNASFPFSCSKMYLFILLEDIYLHLNCIEIRGCANFL